MDSRKIRRIIVVSVLIAFFVFFAVFSSAHHHGLHSHVHAEDCAVCAFIHEEKKVLKDLSIGSASGLVVPILDFAVLTVLFVFCYAVCKSPITLKTKLNN